MPLFAKMPIPLKLGERPIAESIGLALTSEIRFTRGGGVARRLGLSQRLPLQLDPLCAYDR